MSYPFYDDSLMDVFIQIPEQPLQRFSVLGDSDAVVKELLIPRIQSRNQIRKTNVVPEQKAFGETRQ